MSIAIRFCNKLYHSFSIKIKNITHSLTVNIKISLHYCDLIIILVPLFVVFFYPSKQSGSNKDCL